MRWMLWWVAVAAVAQTWELSPGAPAVSLRGVSAVNSQVVWASGARGTILRTADGGASWANVSPPGVADLDFRDIEAVDERTAFALSSGEGRASRLYKTTDGGASWSLLRANGPEGFWDAIAMWDATHGILLGDPVNGRFTILTTSDGVSWSAQPGPRAEKGEAAFAASGTALVAHGARQAWFVTGGPGGGRVFRTEDAGKTWAVSRTPVRPGAASAGLFSIAFAGDRGVAVGGDYAQPDAARGHVVLSANLGVSWEAPTGAPRGYRSAVAYVPQRRVWIAVGASGADISEDGGRTWRGFDDGAWNAVSVAADGAVWAVGPHGRIARLLF